MRLQPTAPLDDAFARIDRAREHLTNLKRAIKRYLDAHPDAFVVRVEGKRVEPITLPADPPPRRFGLHIGECVQNLRTALDYLVYALAWFDSGPDAQRRTQFLIEDTPEGFRGRKPRSLEGVSERHVAAIEGLQPYNGQRWLALVRDVSNLDKHNVLPVTMGVTGNRLIAVGLSDEEAEAIGGFRKPGDMGVYYKFAPVVTVPGGMPAIDLLQLLISETRSLLQAFELEFEGWEAKMKPMSVTRSMGLVGPYPSPPSHGDGLGE